MSAPRFPDFFRAYKKSFAEMIEAWDEGALERIAKVLQEARDRGATLLIAGNGGSAAIANHTECDATKGTFHDAALPRARPGFFQEHGDRFWRRQRGRLARHVH